MTKYKLEIRDDQCSTTNEIDDRGHSAISAACDEWVAGGEWGSGGASITTRWTLYDEAGVEIDSGSNETDVPA